MYMYIYMFTHYWMNDVFYSYLQGRPVHEEFQSDTHSQSTSNSEPGRHHFYPQALDREAPHHPLVRSGNVTPARGRSYTRL